MLKPQPLNAKQEEALARRRALEALSRVPPPLLASASDLVFGRVPLTPLVRERFLLARDALV